MSPPHKPGHRTAPAHLLPRGVQALQELGQLRLAVLGYVEQQVRLAALVCGIKAQLLLHREREGQYGRLQAKAAGGRPGEEQLASIQPQLG